MEQIIFKNRDLSLDTFLDMVAMAVSKRVSTDVAKKVVSAMKARPKQRLSKNEAIKLCGRGNIDRWIRTGKLEPAKVTPGKHEFLLSDLQRLQGIQQDYFDK